jgi:sulfur-carrier protein adenylyltransferase/sulfurtransferase
VTKRGQAKVDGKTTILEITPKELKARMDQGNAPFLLDIREPHEIEICTIKHEHSGHIPMQQVPSRVQELDAYRDKDLVVYCRSGGRSANVANFLRAQGFKSVINLTGGVLAWSDEVDPSMPKY